MRAVPCVHLTEDKGARAVGVARGADESAVAGVGEERGVEGFFVR